MKKLILFILILVVKNPSFAQILEVGMELKYSVDLDWLPPNSPPKIIKLIVKKDTVINGEIAFCIAKEEDECGERPYQYFGQDATRMYFYEDTVKHLFHDYSLITGDTLKVKHFQSGLDSLYIRIDSVDTFLKNGRTFKIQYITPHIDDPHGDPNYHGMDYGTIIEGAGSTLEFFFSSPVASPTPCFVSVKYPGESEIVFGSPCNTIVPVKEKNNESGVSIFPNPSSDFIGVNFSVPNRKAAELLLFDTSGKLKKQFYIEKNQSDVRFDLEIPSGFYFYKIQSENLIFEKGKLIRL